MDVQLVVVKGPAAKARRTRMSRPEMLEIIKKYLRRTTQNPYLVHTLLVLEALAATGTVWMSRLASIMIIERALCEEAAFAVGALELRMRCGVML